MKIITIDLGLTGYISILNVNNNEIFVEKTFKIEIEEKDTKILKDKTKESKAVVKNQVSFIKNLQIISDEIKNNNGIEYMCLVEHITTRPFNSNVSSMSLTDTSAVFRCIFECLNLNYLIIQPKNWKNYFKLTKDKQLSRNLYYELIKNNILKININEKKLNRKILNHNLIESILIGVYYIYSQTQLINSDLN